MYSYGDTNWGDKLTAYRGVSFAYDEIGNPLSYYNGRSYTFTWEYGRRLATAEVGSMELEFTYNDEGIRTSKTVNGVTHTYRLNGSQIIAEEFGSTLLVYLYDAAGSPIGMQYRDPSFAEGVFETYWFEKNLQGDIVAVYDENGTMLLSYVYDSWGTFVKTYHNGCTSSNPVVNNPFLYRGYYFDSELGMYYLQSRYYDPVIGRYINADGYLSTGQGLLGYNMYAYCGNNPVNRVDPEGEFWIELVVLAVIVVTCAVTLSGCADTSDDAYSGQANCYAYAMNLENDPRTGEPFKRKPQPGEFAGQEWSDDFMKSGDATKVEEEFFRRLSADAEVLGLKVTRVNFASYEAKQGNWVVALAYASDGSDYHWYKRDPDGTWSHKRGAYIVENWDYAHRTITDPANCNRGKYDCFLGYYEIGPN